MTTSTGPPSACFFTTLKLTYTHYRNVISHLLQVDDFLKLPVVTSSLDERACNCGGLQSLHYL